MLGLTTTAAARTREHHLRTIVRTLPAEVELWVGGRGATRCRDLISPRGRILSDYNAYQQELARISGHAG